MKASYAELANEFKKTKSELAYTRLYNKIRPSLRTYIMSMVKDHDVCDDLLSRTFIKIYEKIDTYDPQFAITTWAYTIAKRECFRWIKRERNPRVSLSYLMESGSQAIEGDDDIQGISRAGLDFEDKEYRTEESFIREDEEFDATYNLAVEEIKNLKPLYRDILVDNLFNKLKYREIAFKYDEGLRKLDEKLKELKTLSLEKKVDVSDFSKAKKEYDAYYKQSLQRVKNRIRRGKSLVAEAITEKYPNHSL